MWNFFCVFLMNRDSLEQENSWKKKKCGLGQPLLWMPEIVIWGLLAAYSAFMQIMSGLDQRECRQFSKE